MQVVTNENMAEFIQNRSVPDFVPPKADAKVEVKAEPVKADAEPSKEGEQPRAKDGTFVKADEVKPDEAAQAADDDEDDADLPERVRRQIGKKHRAMREAEEFAREMRTEREAERERADRAEAALKAAQGTKSGPASESGQEPKQEDFKTVGEWAKAYAKYEVDREFKERDAKRDQEQREQAMQVAQAAHQKRIEAAAKEIPDYAEVIADSDIDLPPHMTVYIAESPVGPKLGYYLVKHPDEYDRISKLSPIRAIAELGKLEDRLEKKPEPKAKEPEAEVQAVSRAPSPIKPLEGSSATVTKDPAKMTIPELREHERAQRLARARR